jgi:hypothetical protein
MTSAFVRRAIAVVVAAGVALGLTTGPAGATTGQPGAPPLQAFRFGDCPALPPGADPHTWRCEVHLATAELTLGPQRIPGLVLMITHAEGPLPDGSSGQVFGAMHSLVAPVPGHGRPALGVEVRYAGYADLIGNGPDPGGMYLQVAVHGAGLGPRCVIGTTADPVKIHPMRVGDTTVVPTDPPIRLFTLADTTFAVPAATGCHGRDRVVDARFGLPSTSGNVLTLHSAYTYRMYDALHA